MGRTESFQFDSIPATLEELRALPEAALRSPFAVSALTVLALCNFGTNESEAIRMLNFLRGPQPLTNYDIQFLRDRLGGKHYKPFSFFEGTTPDNDYTPVLPYRIQVFDGPYSYTMPGYAKLKLRSSGADTARELLLRTKPSTGEWFLWENYLLPDIRIPKGENPWA